MEFTKYPVDENGLILYPDDSEWRRSIFPEKVFRHPAKANLHIISDVVDYTTEPGDTVMDIMAGTGSIMIAAMRDRRVVCIELEEGYQKLLFEGRQRIEELYPDARDIITILCGDCRDFLPIPVNHILFSPPYSSCMNIRKVRKQKEGADDYLVEQDRQMMEYSKHPRNLSKLNTFLYNQTMERIYKLCWQSILPGGTLTIIIKDRIENGERVYLSKWVDKVCRGIGFTLFGWFKWKAPGSGFTNIARSQGRLVVDDEDIILYRKGSNPNDDWEKAEQQVQDYMDWKFRHEEEATCRNER